MPKNVEANQDKKKKKKEYESTCVYWDNGCIVFIGPIYLKNALQLFYVELFRLLCEGIGHI